MVSLIIFQCWDEAEMFVFCSQLWDVTCSPIMELILFYIWTEIFTMLIILSKNITKAGLPSPWSHTKGVTRWERHARILCRHVFSHLNSDPFKHVPLSRKYVQIIYCTVLLRKAHGTVELSHIAWKQWQTTWPNWRSVAWHASFLFLLWRSVLTGK